VGLKGCAPITVPVGGTARKGARRLRGAGWSDRVGSAGSLGFTPESSGQTEEFLTEAGCFIPGRFFLSGFCLHSSKQNKRKSLSKEWVWCRSEGEDRF